MQNYNISSLPPSFSNLFLKFPDTYIKRYPMRKIQFPLPRLQAAAASETGLPHLCKQDGLPFYRQATLFVFQATFFGQTPTCFFIISGKTCFPAALRPNRRADTQIQQARTDRLPTPQPHLPRKKMSTASIPVANDLKTLSANQWDPHFQPAPLPDAPDAGGHRQAPLQTPP